MTTMETKTAPEAWTVSTSRRAQALAERLERGASALESLAETLAPNEWASVVPGDGRTIGVIVHHVASMYPLEIELAQGLAEGRPIAGVTWAAVHAINAEHARANSTVSKEEAIDLLRRNSAAAAAAIRAFNDEQLDAAATISLNADAPLTCQFFLEDHAVRHSFHHLARIRAALPTVVVCGDYAVKGLRPGHRAREVAASRAPLG